MPKKLSDVLEASCRILMRPIARFFVSSGLQYSDFLEISRAEFAKAACDVSPPSEATSSIASRIGIGRRELTRFRDEEDIDVRKLAYTLSYPAMVLSRWHQDSEFVREDGVPRRISAAEFRLLVAGIDSDIVPDRILKELLSSKAIEAHLDGSFSPKIRYFIPRGGDPRRILRFGIRVGDLANTLHRNAVAAEPSIEASVYNSHVPIKHLPIFRSVARTHGNGLLQSLDDWLTAHAEPGSDEVVRAGVGVYFFEDDPKFAQEPD